jgi:hypothetical protein
MCPRHQVGSREPAALIAHAPGTGKESQHVFPDALDWPSRSDLGKITSAGFVVVSLLKVQ